MSSVLKGVAVGACNVVVVAFGLAITQSSFGGTSELFTVVCELGFIPGLVAGALIGFLAGRLTTLRRLALVSLAVFAVAVLGMLLEPRFIGFASIPTIIAALGLERWTRSNVAPRMRSSTSLLSSTSKGALLGIANVAVTAILIGVMVGLDPPLRGWSGDGETLGFGFAPYVKGSAIGIQITLLVGFVGLLPGLVTGVGLGRLADSLRAFGPHARFAILGGLAMVTVAILGLLTKQAPIIAASCVPALIASLVLERWTREADALPRAIARG